MSGSDRGLCSAARLAGRSNRSVCKAAARSGGGSYQGFCSMATRRNLVDPSSCQERLQRTHSRIVGPDNGEQTGGRNHQQVYQQIVRQTGPPTDGPTDVSFHDGPAGAFGACVRRRRDGRAGPTWASGTGGSHRSFCKVATRKVPGDPLICPNSGRTHVAARTEGELGQNQKM